MQGRCPPNQLHTDAANNLWNTLRCHDIMLGKIQNWTELGVSIMRHRYNKNCFPLNTYVLQPGLGWINQTLTFIESYHLKEYSNSLWRVPINKRRFLSQITFSYSSDMSVNYPHIANTWCVRYVFLVMDEYNTGYSAYEGSSRVIRNGRLIIIPCLHRL